MLNLGHATDGQSLDYRRLGSQSFSLPLPLAFELSAALRDWEGQGATRRLWDGDASLWTGGDEGRWLGWLKIVDRMLDDLAPLRRLQESMRSEGFTHAVVLGMGGSSLAPEVLGKTFGQVPGSPRILVLDSTDPAQIRAVEESVDLRRTLFIVSSKSGTTLEPNILERYFVERVRETLGPGTEAGNRFIAITDPGSALEHEAVENGFRLVFPGVTSIGGRYSGLSNFGMVPAAVMGLDVQRLLENASRMLNAWAPGVPAADNPGLALGILLGVAARAGADKLTFVASPGIRSLGAWLEQLIAESTGKAGKGIIPVDDERPGAPEVYGDDRLFVYLRLDETPDAGQDSAVEALERAGKPVIRIGVANRYHVALELIRWEIATAVAGAVLGINPFDQPDVEASKTATRALTAEYERSGVLPPEAAFFEGGGLALFADDPIVEGIRRHMGAPPTLVGCLRGYLDLIRGGDYFAVLAYLPMTAPNEEALQAIRHRVRDARRVATCLGFGPRFLHSTGQAYKGGPASGVFLQVTCDDALDLAVPGRGYTFGVVKAAQARGDLRVLQDRDRRALRVHLGRDVARGLATLEAALSAALAGDSRKGG